MDSSILIATSEIIKKDFEMENAGAPPTDEAEMLLALAYRIEELLENQPEFLMSMLYRLDVEESKIRRAMHPSAADAPNIGLAKLVWERQKQRVWTKQNIKTDPLADAEDWKW